MRVILSLFALFALAVCQTNFDARTKWPGCANFILNQQQCGSCWDFCSVESFADRMCITGEAPSGTIISPEPILDCSIDGCGGGNPSVAWNWMIKNGDSTCTRQCFSGCSPYDSGAGSSPSCHKGTCDSGSAWPVTYFAGSFKSLPKGALSTFQTELSTYGPLQACFTVYNNFYTYFDNHPTGIYSSASGGVVGGHCVKMIGWGVESGTNYWYAASLFGGIHFLFTLSIQVVCQFLGRYLGRQWVLQDGARYRFVRH
jgi:cathepsin B